MNRPRQPSGRPSPYPQVRVRCERCQRVLGQLRGDGQRLIDVHSARWMRTPDSLVAGEHNPYPCRCGASYAARTDKLERAYRIAVARPDRTIWLPRDLRS